MRSHYVRPLEAFGYKVGVFKVGTKLRSDRYQCSLCGVMVGKSDSTCPHCGADLR